jgi:hypothetical protein
VRVKDDVDSRPWILNFNLRERERERERERGDLGMDEFCSNEKGRN